MNNNTKDIFTNFYTSLNTDDIKDCSYQVKRIIKKREKRLKDNDIREDQNIIYKDRSIKVNDISNSNQTFKNELYSIYSTKRITYYRKERQIGYFDFDNLLFANVTSINDMNRIYHHNYNCINCGSLLTIKTLIEGCLYCNTKYITSDIYPVVTNYYRVKVNVKSAIGYIYKIIFLISLVVLFVIISLIVIDSAIDTNYIIGFLLLLGIPSIPFIIMLNAIFFIKLNKKTIKSLNNKYPLVSKESLNKMNDFMKDYDPNFSFSLFQNKILSMFKELIFSDDVTKLSIYDSNKKLDFSNIIDSDYTGGLEVIDIKEVDGYINIKIKFSTIDTIIFKDGVFRTLHDYKAIIYRNKDVITTSDFRIYGINCKSCGFSVDFDKDCHCSHCNSSYNLKDYDFVFKELNLENQEKNSMDVMIHKE